MRLHPRHYALLAVLVLLGIWNFARLHRAHETRTPIPTPAPTTPGWQAFDHAADLRNAPDGQFTPALNALRAKSTSASGVEAADLQGCTMWLLYYRHSAPSAAGKPGDWSQLATGHVQSCLAMHRDVGR